MRTPYQPTVNCIKLTCVLHALSDPTRLRIARSLYQDSEQCPSTFLEMNVAKSTLSHHIKVLRESGVIKVRIECKQHHYSLRKEDLNALFPGLLEVIFQIDEERI
ncbi:ArsR/SmtB family transcription factor [Brevibacillus ginsengisoli]|uniref:ArsR/SmtB family transcription factor n=1 Tax=Brevibacillus ginsengisoli TaxID=363854 RepID=UPI003CF5273C